MTTSGPLNTFAGLSLSLDRMSEKRNNATWLAAMEASNRARYLLLDSAGNAFFEQHRQALRWLNMTERERLLAGQAATLLGLTQEKQPYFLLTLDEQAHLDTLKSALGARCVDLHEASHWLGADEASLFAYAKGLLHWQHQTRRCARCGAAVRSGCAGHRLDCTNPMCGQTYFPRIDVAIVVLVEHEGACLLGRQARWPVGRYSTLAGFVEPGEALEDAVRREVTEESGVIVNDIRYHSSQPWPMPASLMTAFMATARTREIRIRDHELEDVCWFTPKQIVDGLHRGRLLVPSRPSVSYRLLTDWLKECAQIKLDEQLAITASGHA